MTAGIYIILGFFLIVFGAVLLLALKLKDYDKWYKDYYDIK